MPSRRATRRRASALIGALWLGGSLACATSQCPGQEAGRSAALWPAADALFRSDARFRGGDAAYSAPLDDERVLWLFGDSFVGEVPPGTRANTRMVRNALGVQQGRDPSTARLRVFYDDAESEPAAFFDDGDGDDATFVWPGPAAHLGDVVLLLQALVRTSSEGLGFETFGARALLLENPADDASLFRFREVPLPGAPGGVNLGLGALLVSGERLYAYAPVEPGSHDVYLARFDAGAARAGDLSSPSWWGGAWQSDALGAVPVVRALQTEFSVHRAPDGRLWMVSVDGFGGTSVVVRTASAPEGEWSAPTVLLRPPESDRDDVLVYSAKAHPELAGGDVVVTYCTNHLDFWTLAADMSLYFPRFIVVDTP